MELVELHGGTFIPLDSSAKHAKAVKTRVQEATTKCSITNHQSDRH